MDVICDTYENQYEVLVIRNTAIEDKETVIRTHDTKNEDIVYDEYEDTDWDNYGIRRDRMVLRSRVYEIRNGLSYQRLLENENIQLNM